MYKVWKFEYEKNKEGIIVRKVVAIQGGLTFEDAKKVRDLDRGIQISKEVIHNV